MKNPIQQTLKFGAGAALVAFGFTGCMTNSEPSNNGYASSGENAFIKQESENMGAVWNSGTAAAPKLAVDTSTPDTITGDLVIVRLHYDSACGCFVRTANFTNSVGYERQRLDTITLVDSSGNNMPTFHPEHAASLVHKRHVTRINANTGKEVDCYFNTTLTWTTDSAGHREGIWNGTISGSFNGVIFKSGTITNVVRAFHPDHPLNRWFGFPSAGTIHLERLILGVNFTIDVVFTGEGTATVTITNTKNGNVHIINIDIHNNPTL
jgi:hypothetical protein